MATQREPSARGGDAVHQPVLVAEIAAALERGLGRDVRGTLVDGTVGAGGHAFELLTRFPGLDLVGCDWDPDSLAIAERTLAPLGARVELVRAALGDFAATFAERPRPIAVIADLGVCSLHFDRAERGFSVQADGPLDMRMDPRTDLTAADIVNRWSEEDLADLFFREGGEHKSRRAAAAIVEARRRVPFKRTAALAELLAGVLGRAGRVHPATRVFQALRRAVNDEGRQLDDFLAAALAILAPGGVLAVITFHSGEDGVVKRAFSAAVDAGDCASLTDGAVEPSAREVRENPRARSARLRAVQRVPNASGGAR